MDFSRLRENTAIEDSRTPYWRLLACWLLPPTFPMQRIAPSKVFRATLPLHAGVGVEIMMTHSRAREQMIYLARPRMKVWTST